MTKMRIAAHPATPVKWNFELISRIAVLFSSRPATWFGRRRHPAPIALLSINRFARVGFYPRLNCCPSDICIGFRARGRPARLFPVRRHPWKKNQARQIRSISIDPITGRLDTRPAIFWTRPAKLHFCEKSLRLGAVFFAALRGDT
jgi:hypothetical protein